MSVTLLIDHFVVLVNDLETARQSFIDARFTATEITRHSEAMGTANSCVMLQGSYIELMGVVVETPANEGWRTLLASGPGLKGIALASSDIEATSATLAGKDIGAEKPRHFSRMTAEGELRFSVVRLSRDLTPGLQCIYCEHHTRDLLWTPQAMDHANGATRLVAATIPGVSALAPLETTVAGLLIDETSVGSITIETREPVSKSQSGAILKATGLRVETRPVA